MSLAGRRVLVTGGTGSLGQALVQRLLAGPPGEAERPAKVLVLSRDEAKQHEMRLAFLRRRVTTDEVIFSDFRRSLEFRIGDVRSYGDVCAALRDVDVVIHAAALKQVPTCEYFPEQAVLTNCLGAINLVRAIHEHGFEIEAVVGVSTDKAVKPVNVMGMTKAVQERILIAGNLGSRGTRFVCVRYGNVLASRGSVIPLFLHQIRRGGPVTVTMPEMTRFLLDLDQAVDTVLSAGATARAGETYVPRAPAATVLNIARALIGERDVPIEVTGIRPGEKLHEVLVSEEECRRTSEQDGRYVIAPMLPELEADVPSASTLGREYCSADHVLGLEETGELLARFGLEVESPVAGSTGLTGLTR